MRTFALNSREFYEAVCEPRERPWIPNGALPREPRVREREVVVEAGAALVRDGSGVEADQTRFRLRSLYRDDSIFCLR